MDRLNSTAKQFSNPLTDWTAIFPRAELGGLYLRMRQSDWSGMAGLCGRGAGGIME